MGNFIVRVSHVGVGDFHSKSIPQEITPEIARAISRAAEVTRKRWRKQSGHNEKAVVNSFVERCSDVVGDFAFYGSREIISEFVLAHERLEGLIHERLSAVSEKKRMMLAEKIHREREKRNKIFNQISERGLQLEIINRD